MVNLGSAIAFHAVNTPDRCAIVYEDRRLSFAELHASYRRVAALLIDRGVEPGDRVAVLMKNSLAFIQIALATSHVGAVFLPINFRLSASEVAYIVDDAEARLMFLDEELADKTPPGQQHIRVSQRAQADAAVLATADLPDPPAVARDPSDLYRLMYTSGTTSDPKGVMHTYANAAWKTLDHIIALHLSNQVRLLIVGPLYHVGACDLPGLAVLAVGGSIVVLRDFDPVAVMAAIEREKITGVWMAPVMMNAVLETSACHRFDVSSLQWCVAGGERSVETRIRQFGTIFANARFIDAYGLTESCSGDTFMQPGRELDKIGSVGRAVAHVAIEIRDMAGQRLPVGREGEICLRGPKITPGYWRNPQKTADSFYGAWFRTGDIGSLDSEGFLTITDRAKDMIISGGENIASSEVERVVYQLPEIADAAVIGMPDPRWGEQPVLVAVLKPGATLDLARVTEFCRSRLASFKAPRKLWLVDALPRNPSGKVLKRLLREQLTAIHADADQE